MLAGCLPGCSYQLVDWVAFNGCIENIDVRILVNELFSEKPRRFGGAALG
jgi:hypothetical protein